MMMALSASSETAYCLLNALTGQYNCSLSPWDDDSIASDPYLINLQADDNSFYSPHNVTCSDWDDDTVYDEESCEGFDSGACQGSFDGPSITWPTVACSPAASAKSPPWLILALPPPPAFFTLNW